MSAAVSAVGRSSALRPAARAAFAVLYVAGLASLLWTPIPALWIFAAAWWLAFFLPPATSRRAWLRFGLMVPFVVGGAAWIGLVLGGETLCLGTETGPAPEERWQWLPPHEDCVLTNPDGSTSVAHAALTPFWASLLWGLALAALPGVGWRWWWRLAAGVAATFALLVTIFA